HASSTASELLWPPSMKWKGKLPMTRLRPALVLLAVIVTSTLSLLLAKESLATRPLPPNEVRLKLTMPVATGGDPIDLSTGLFFAEHTDFFLPDVIPIMFTRTYRTADPSWSFASF